jgi:hypothetical protein
MVAAINQLHAGVYAGEDGPLPERVSVTESGRVYPVVAPAPRRMPVRTRVVELEGDYAGWRATVRTNAPFANFLKLASLGNTDDGAAVLSGLAEIYGLLPRLVLDWNFVDEDGEPLPCNREGFAQLPADLMVLLVSAVNGAGDDAPKA